MKFKLPFEEKGTRVVSARTEKGKILSLTFTDGVAEADDKTSIQLCELLPNLKKCKVTGRGKKGDDAVIHTESSNTEEGE